MSKRLQEDRRLFLKSLGLGAGSYFFNPFLNSLLMEANAQTVAPQKLILFYMNAQPSYPNRPVGEFLPKGSNFNIQAGMGYENCSSVPMTKMLPGDWPTVLSSMAPFFQNSLIVEGVFHGGLDQPGQATHGLRYAGLNGICGNVLTGLEAELDIPYAPTIDQIIAQGPSGQGVTYPSLLLGLANSDYTWQNTYTDQTVACFASGANSPVPYISRTTALERKLFGQNFVSGTTVSAGQTALLTARRTRVMDALKKDIVKLERNINSEYKDKLTTLLTSLDLYDKKKQAELTVSASCKPPAPSKLGSGSPPELELMSLVDGATLALQCGLTNVVGIASGVEIKHASDVDFRYNVDAKLSDRWFSGTVSPSSTTPFYNSGWDYHKAGPEWEIGNERVVRFYVGLLARMLENLSGQKGVMPPNTTVILVSDRGMSNNSHSHGFNGINGRQPIFIWSTNPKINAQGQYIRYKTSSRYNRWTGFDASLSDFYRTFASAFGVNLSSFGVYGGRFLNEIVI